MNKILCAIFCFAGLLLIACGNNKQVAGGVDANTNFLQGRLILADTSQQVDSMLVQLYKSTPTGFAKRLATASSWILIDSTYTNARGNYEFKVISDGDYLIRAKLGDSTLLEQEISYEAAEGVTLDPIALPIPFMDKVLLDDFEDGDTLNFLNNWFHEASEWSFEITDSTRIRSTIHTVENCLDSGKCYHMVSDTIAPEALYTLSLIDNRVFPAAESCVSIPSADSLQFMAKGTGTVYYAYWAMDSTKSWETAELISATADLSGAWKHYSIPLNLPSDHCLHKVLFGLQGQGELWLDNIWIHGINLIDLSK